MHAGKPTGRACLVCSPQLPSGRPLSRLTTLRALFASSRRRLLARVGRVFTRNTGATAASRISATRRSRASVRLRSWVRWRFAAMISTPSAVIRRPASTARRDRMAGVSAGECRASNRSCTAVATLLTFWPPGPAAAIKRSSSSD